MFDKNADMFTLRSSRLSVEIARPGSPVQLGARFDLTGHAVQVTLDGKHTFCAPESFDALRGSGGLGLCNEFKDETGQMYAEAGQGEPYPKLGIGLLTRDTNGYEFMRHYRKQLFPMDVSATDDTAEFTAHPVDCRGFAALLKKRLTVQDNTLTMAYELLNTGSRALHLTEYNHNFVCIDNHPIGPDYRLALPYGIKLEQVPPVLTVSGQEFGWNAVPDAPFYCEPHGFEGVNPHAWELTHLPSGVGMRETDDFVLHHVAFWGMSHVASLEAFIQIDLEPGESKRWTRTYTFFC